MPLERQAERGAHGARGRGLAVGPDDRDDPRPSEDETAVETGEDGEHGPRHVQEDHEQLAPPERASQQPRDVAGRVSPGAAHGAHAIIDRRCAGSPESPVVTRVVRWTWTVCGG